MPKGGYRKGAGRKKGSGKWMGEDSVPVRVPVGILDRVKAILQEYYDYVKGKQGNEPKGDDNKPDA